MALDTRNKRASAVGLGPAVRVLPSPDGAMAAGDRAQVGFTYRGLFDASATNPDPVGWRVLRGGSPRFGVGVRGLRASIRARA